MTNPLRSALRLLAAWTALLLVAWTAVWALREALVRVWPALAGGGAALAFWNVAKVLVWLAPALWLCRREQPDGLASLGLHTARGLGTGLVAAAAWTGALAAQGAWTGAWPAPATASWALLGAGVLSPLFEETLHRGFALRLLQRRGAPFRLAGPFTALLFLALHLPGWLFTRPVDAALGYDAAAVFVFGLAAAALAWKVPSLWAPIVLHATNNAWSAGVFARLAASGGSGP